MATKAKVSRPAKAMLRELGYASEADTAATLGIEVPTLKNRASAGKAPRRYRLGKTTVYRIDEVAAWIARQRVAA